MPFVGLGSTVIGMARPLDPRMLDACVEGLAATHQQLLQVADDISLEQFSGPSRLDGWTRGTLVGHLVMNARSFIHVLSASSQTEAIEQYPGGAPAREAAIAEAAQWDMTTSVSELRKSVYTLEGAIAGATFDNWNRTYRSTSGATVAVHEIPFLRWRECVVHLTDLDVGIEWDQWPDLYVRLELERQKMAWTASHPMGLTQIPQAAMELSDKHRLAWLLQRVEVDKLPKGPGL